MVDVGPEEIDGKLRRSFVPVLCLHCENPYCMNVCPSEAIKKDENGMVLIEETLCAGCKLCLTACPISALQYKSLRRPVVDGARVCLVSWGCSPALLLAGFRNELEQRNRD